MAMQPETWKPPMQTCRPAARNCAREVDRARKLIRLHPDEADQRAPAAPLEVANDAARHDAAIGFVIGVELDRHSRAQHLARLASSARLFMQASVLEGNAERNHWIG